MVGRFFIEGEHSHSNICKGMHMSAHLTLEELKALVRTVPDGVFYNSVGARGSDLNIKGVAESNNRVSSLMRRLDASDWLKEPNLDAVRAAPAYGEQANTFDLTVKVDLPANDSGSED